MVRMDELKDDDLDTARRGYRNLLAAVGFIGGMRVVLNPMSAQEVRQVASEYYDDCSVKLVGFNDTFEAYDINPE